MAAPFDLDVLEITGPAVPVLEDLMQAYPQDRWWPLNTGAAQYCISNSGALAYVAGGTVPDIGRRNVWLDLKGRAEPLPGERDFGQPRFSPDGRKVAFDRKRRLWISDMAREDEVPLTHEGQVFGHAWNPGGKELAVGYAKAGNPNIFLLSASGGGKMVRLTTSEYSQVPSSWSPDGAYLAYCEYRPGTTLIDIWVLRLSDKKAQPFVQTKFPDQCPDFSPDGKWLAYYSGESGRGEVYVQSFPGPGEKHPISTDGGSYPVWAPNGRELYYRRNKDEMWVVDIATEPTFKAGKPRLLFKSEPYKVSSPNRNHDLHPDGTRFLMVQNLPQTPQPATEIILVQNWFEELKRLCPTGK